MTTHTDHVIQKTRELNAQSRARRTANPARTAPSWDASIAKVNAMLGLKNGLQPELGAATGAGADWDDAVARTNRLYGSRLRRRSPPYSASAEASAEATAEP